MPTAIQYITKSLVEANDYCRSAYQIAKRDGKDTNWAAFRKGLAVSLKQQQKVIQNYSAYEESNKLVYELADEAAASDIEVCCCDDVAPKGWYNSESTLSEPETIERAIRYLRTRGLLERHPKNPKWIRPIFGKRRLEKLKERGEIQ